MSMLLLQCPDCKTVWSELTINIDASYHKSKEGCPNCGREKLFWVIGEIYEDCSMVNRHTENENKIWIDPVP